MNTTKPEKTTTRHSRDAKTGKVTHTVIELSPEEQKRRMDHNIIMRFLEDDTPSMTDVVIALKAFIRERY